MDGWLCEPELASFHSWMADAPWYKCNAKGCHQSAIRDLRSKTGVAHIGTLLGEVTTETLLPQLFYGNSAINPHEMMGLSTYYNMLDCDLAQAAVQVIDGGYEKELTSAWVIGWGPKTIFMVTPNGTPPNGAGKAALVINDWRYAVRVANINQAIDPPALRRLLDLALSRLPSVPRNPDKLRHVIYMNPDLVMAEIYRGIFIRPIDALRKDEIRVGGA